MEELKKMKEELMKKIAESRGDKVIQLDQKNWEHMEVHNMMVGAAALSAITRVLKEDGDPISMMAGIPVSIYADKWHGEAWGKFYALGFDKDDRYAYDATTMTFYYDISKRADNVVEFPTGGKNATL